MPGRGSAVVSAVVAGVSAASGLRCVGLYCPKSSWRLLIADPSILPGSRYQCHRDRSAQGTESMEGRCELGLVHQGGLT